MKFNLERGSGNVIHSYTVDAIRIVVGAGNAEVKTASAQKTITTSLILTPSSLVEDWIGPDEALTIAHLEQILSLEPEIILLGTGPGIRFPAPELLAHAQRRQVGLEVLDTGAVCRTYNILAAEGRRVCAAFMKI